MVTIDGTDISGATIDGTEVQEITMDGDVVWTGIPDSDMYQDQEWVRDSWDTLYEIPPESGVVDETEGPPMLEQTDIHPLSQWEVGSFDGSFDVTHGDMGRYIVEERENDGFYWITAESTSGSSSDYGWAASTELRLDDISTIEFRLDNDNTNRGSSGYEFGIEGEAFESDYGVAEDDITLTADVSHLSGTHEIFVLSNGGGRHDTGTRASVTELDLS